jgi:hypothetical protein
VSSPGAPLLTVYANGQGTVSAGDLLTFEQTCDTLAQLRAFTGVTGLQVFLRGYTAPGDGGQGPFYWSATATGPDNGTTIIVPTGAIVGAWLRIPVVAMRTVGLPFCADGGGSVIPTGVMRYGYIPFAFTITGWALQAEVVGSLVLDVWALAEATDTLPTVANTICAGVYPTLAGNSQVVSTTLTGWATNLAAGTSIGINVRSVATVTKPTLTLFGTATG